MNFYVYSLSEHDKDIKRVANIIRKLYKDSTVEESKGKLGKYKLDKMAQEGTLVIKTEDVLGGSNKDVALAIVGIAGVGVSEKVLNSI